MLHQQPSDNYTTLQHLHRNLGLTADQLNPAHHISCQARQLAASLMLLPPRLASRARPSGEHVNYGHRIGLTRLQRTHAWNIQAEHTGGVQSLPQKHLCQKRPGDHSARPPGTLDHANKLPANQSWLAPRHPLHRRT